ncbi:MAG: hypothetical protein AAF732_19675, partial [Pseudomonadota bacterium]
AKPPQAARTAATRTKVAIAPVIGAPENVASQLTTQLTTALASKGVGVVPAGQSGDYTLRGYVVAARERVGTKVSYIWDVTDPKGKRVNRITGEEVVRGSNGRDPWAAISPAVISSIVAKTSSSLGNWLPARGPGAQPASPAVASNSATTPKPQPRQTSAPTRTASIGNATTTGSIPRSGLLAISPTVTGAPGDGSKSLSRALRRELNKGGVRLTGAPNPRAFNINGKVALGAAKSGKQSIQIDWVVTDANGTNVGTVTQKNEIPAGSLNGAWGQTADAAAAAAAQGIVRLMRQNATATN